MSESAPDYQGKVRDIYELTSDKLLMVASDRVSVYDVVLNEPIPGKGKILTGMTVGWLDRLGEVAPNHLITTNLTIYENLLPLPVEELQGRAMIVKKARMLPIEFIVRGYLTGSGWEEYQAAGTLHGMRLPKGLPESVKLPEPLLTPSTKATEGHDENISKQEMAGLIGRDDAEQAESMCLQIYNKAAKYALARGIIIADTKFELGLIDSDLHLCDEILTPDSSRFWPVDQYEEGITPPSLDKQFLRDWAESTGWDKRPPPPTVPDDIIQKTNDRYYEADERLNGPVTRKL